MEHLEMRLEADDLPAHLVNVTALSGHEAISQLFRFDIDIVYFDPEGLDREALAGSNASLVFERSGLEVRRIRGMIAAVDDALDTQTDFRTYRLRLVPRAFRLTLVEAHDIFMNLTVPEIIEQKLGLMNLADSMERRLASEYPKRDFVVQYGETELAFISRLAEHLGISFFFEHDESGDRIVFADNAGGFARIEEPASIPFRGGGEKRDVFRIAAATKIVPASYVVRDYNYRTPQLDLTSSYALEAGLAGGIIEYGSHFKTPEEGAVLARIRGEERRSSQLVYEGESDLPVLAAGACFTLEDHPHLPEAELLVVSIEHRVSQAGTGQPQVYSNTFKAVSATETYRPPRITPRPRMPGLVTAVIEAGLNASDTVASLDDQGRYLLRLLFDTSAASGGSSSRPVRMAQPHAGADHGMHFPIKPGTEVIVAFINGDPDRPIIVGALHNVSQPSPVGNRNPKVHRIKIASGITFDMVDD